MVARGRATARRARDRARRGYRRHSRARGGDAHRRARRTMAIERMSSKSHIRVRVRATVRPRAPPRSGDATRTKKFASRDVADADPRPRASFARAVPSLSLSLFSLAPPSRLAPRRPDARASRAGETRRRRVRATTRSGDRRRERARRGREVDGVHPWMISSERGETRARSPDASTGLDRRTASCERSMASRRGRAVESSSRRPSRTRARLRHPSRPSPCLLYTSPSPRDQRGSRMPSSA